MADVDRNLAKMLQLAKRKPLNFAIIAMGSSVVHLLLSKKPIQAGMVSKAKSEFSGNAVVKGLVRGGSGPELVFQVTEKPSVGEVKLRVFITEATGLTLKVSFEVLASLVEVNDDSDDDGVDVAGEKAVVSGTIAPPNMEALTAAFERLKPAIQEAVTNRPTIKDDIVQLVTTFQLHLKAADVAAARESLFELGGLLKSLAGRPASTGTTATETQPDRPKKDLADAPGSPQPGGRPAIGAKVAYAQLLLLWEAARKKGHAELKKLEDAILEEFGDDARSPDLPQKIRKLDQVMARFDNRLQDALNDAQGLPEAERSPLHAEARKIIQEYKAYVDGDEFISAIETNPFVPVAVQSTLSTVFGMMLSKLPN